jgi:hypothetical protein
VRLDHRSVVVQNFALNVAEKGFPISVYNRSYEKTEACVTRAKKEGVQGIVLQRRYLQPGIDGSISGLEHLLSYGYSVL